MEIVEVAKDSALVEMNKGACEPPRLGVELGLANLPLLLGIPLLLPPLTRCEPPGHARGGPPPGGWRGVHRDAQPHRAGWPQP